MAKRGKISQGKKISLLSDQRLDRRDREHPRFPNCLGMEFDCPKYNEEDLKLIKEGKKELDRACKICPWRNNPWEK